MKYRCEMIRDLLPLYIDSACSNVSAEAVEEHIAECSDCAALFGEMNSCGETIETPLAFERNNILADQAKVFKRRSTVSGAIIGGLFMIPALICMFIDSITGFGLSWSLIVLTAMLIPASLILIPLLMKENKGLWTLIAFTSSLLTLLGVCCLYSGGRWFLVTASSVLFGLTVIFSPFVVRSKPIAAKLGNNKALTVLAVDMLGFMLMMFSIGLHSALGTALAYAAPFAGYILGIVVLLCLPKLNRYFRIAACICFSAVSFFFSDTATLFLLGRGIRFPKLTFSFSDAISINDNICWFALFAGIILAVIFAVKGVKKETNRLS